MPLINAVGGTLEEHNTVPGLELAGLHLGVIEMRPAVRSSVESGDFHGAVFIVSLALKHKVLLEH